MPATLLVLQVLYSHILAQGFQIYTPFNAIPGLVPGLDGWQPFPNQEGSFSSLRDD